MSFGGLDADAQALARRLVEIAVQARASFPRDGFDGLDPAALQVLLVLVSDGPQSARALSEHLAMNGSTVRHGLANLEAAGCAARTRNDAVGGVIQAAATEQGEAVAARFLQRV